MPSTTPLALCNAALALIGSDQLTALDEGTDLAAIVNALYDDTVRGLLSSHPWRFTLTKQRLARQPEAPLTEWRYSHALPADRLVLRQLTTSANIGAPPLQAYELFENRVYSNALDLWADYQTEPHPGLWPPYVTNLARHALAAAFAIPVAESAERADYDTRLAFGTPGEGGAGGLAGLARRLDAQQQPNQALGDFPLVTARLGGTW